MSNTRRFFFLSKVEKIIKRREEEKKNSESLKETFLLHLAFVNQQKCIFYIKCDLFYQPMSQEKDKVF